ncbi:MAG: helix-turn-helix transcriptional regulator [Deltaproteobacteria bacterium]|nr:helix-turn-helix transcriptional regulator [Deltaproteobacteria bacterium]
MNKFTGIIRLRNVREKLNLTLAELAAKVGITAQSLSFLERGIIPGGRIETWNRISKVLGVPIKELRRPYLPHQSRRRYWH